MSRLKQENKKEELKMQFIQKIIDNIEKGSRDIPPVTGSVKNGVNEIRAAVENVYQVVQSLKKNVLIRSHIPPEPQPEAVDAGLR